MVASTLVPGEDRGQRGRDGAATVVGPVCPLVVVCPACRTVARWRRRSPAITTGEADCDPYHYIPAPRAPPPPGAARSSGGGWPRRHSPARRAPRPSASARRGAPAAGSTARTPSAPPW